MTARSLRCVVRPSKSLLLQNHWADLHQTSQEWSLGGLLPKLFKELNLFQNSGCHGNQKEKLKKKSSCPKPQGVEPQSWACDIILWSSTNIVQVMPPGMKRGPARGSQVLHRLTCEKRLKNLA